MLNRFSILVAPMVVAVATAQTGNIEQRIDALMQKMTLEEKLGQMSQTAFQPLSEGKVQDEVRKGRWGSFYNGGSLAEKLEIQRIAVHESRLGIPLIFGQDVIHGCRTIWPIPIGQAATWDPDLVSKACRVTGKEATSEGVHWTFSPMVDIARDPRWGRTAEGYGEDPCLDSQMAAATVHGYQGPALDGSDSLAACPKHYVGYGAAEGGRDYNSTWIPENLLREVYLPAFKAAKDAGAQTFMSAFNALNGVPSSANKLTLRQILRKEWGFDGFVVSDFESVKELVRHGFAANEADAAQKAMDAGVNMEMISSAYWDNGKALVASGKLKMSTVDQAVREILRVKFRLGLFDGRAMEHPAAITKPSAEALSTAQQLARESAILLKNNHNILPLSPSIGKLAVIGPIADSVGTLLGTWSSAEDDSAVTPLKAFRKELGDRVLYAPGLPSARSTDTKGFGAAVKAASNADVVVLFLGEDADMSGEANSRAHLDIPGAQQALFDAIAKTGKPIVSIVMGGRPLTFGAVTEKSAAVFFCFHPGTMGGPGLADLLFGRVSPSGKAPITFPRTIGQIPIPYNHLNTGRPHVEGDQFTTGYNDERSDPAYPFGFGLSYTTFAYSNLQVSMPLVHPTGKIHITADVTNTGGRDADEVVQLYTRRPVASVVRPVRELRGFKRIHLKVGEKATVTFDLNVDDLSFYNAEMQRVNEPGQIRVWIAPNSVSGVEGSFEIAPE